MLSFTIIIKNDNITFKSIPKLSPNFRTKKSKNTISQFVVKLIYTHLSVFKLQQLLENDIFNKDSPALK